MSCYGYVRVSRNGMPMGCAPFGAPKPGDAATIQEKGEAMASHLLGRPLEPEDVVESEVRPSPELLRLDQAFDSLIEASESYRDYHLTKAVAALRSAWARERTREAFDALRRIAEGNAQ